MAFRVGQKVVCVDAGGDLDGRSPGIWAKGEEIVDGQIYTIHSMFPHPADGVLCLRLHEVKRDPAALIMWGHDGYAASRFRPVVERKTDISIFTAMLNPSHNRVEA